MTTNKQFSYAGMTLTRGSTNYDAKHSWLVKNLIRNKSLGVLYGMPDSFKSFTTIDLACSIATGRKYHGEITQQGAVVYIAAEGQQGISRRIKAWERTNNLLTNDLWVLGSSMPLNTPKAQNDFIELIKQLEIAKKVKVELIVIDTLARCMEGDENSPSDMGKFVRACDFIRGATNSSILCVHHSGKDINKGARGSNALVASIDFEFKMKRIKGDIAVMLINTKQKDADTAPPITIQYKQVDLGITCEEGLPITSLANLSQHAPDTRNGISNIIDIINKHPLKSMTRHELNQALFPSTSKIQDSDRQKIKRALDTLIKKKLVTIEKKGVNSTKADIISIIH
ncbi:helicase RepA family protein [Vibrio ziniensis]|uniref:AAA family ATPase n=1 Tax=Vibrio ziniensis TaxID=2711221 RepID=A0A6G7CLD6_9VIBR|nr:helicase RepA family protein [Vibrio ziniensis]QIH42858.1 AAA family ATPase [Vibrio ziniensis]